MIKLEFENMSLVIPEGWHEVKLADYERWNTQKPETKQEYVRFVADVCNVEASVLLEAPAKVFDIITGTIRFVFDSEPEPSNRVNIGGKDYFVSFSDKLTLGEWVDIESVIGSESTGKLSEMLAILCRPAGEKYNSDLAGERQAMFRNLTCDKVLPLIGFFLLKKKRSDEILNHYSTVADQANRFLRDTGTFVINGGGIKLLPIWQRIRYIYLVRSLKKQLSKFSDSSFTA
ncbi:MAG: hypothetical protein LBL79_09625 [Prevotella sp.]|jgi:hypothetical protein|nr:hypothetical protein [Prevotella sp.]